LFLGFFQEEEEVFSNFSFIFPQIKSKNNIIMNFGLIGKNISYSFSKKYFEDKFIHLGISSLYSYDLFDLQNIKEIEKVLRIPNLKGFNVTIPYKEQIIHFLDELSEEAKEIGAVNTIKIFPNGKIKGFNTDAFGFEKTLISNKEKFHNSALILGDGGAAKAVKFVLNKHKIPYKSVFRKSDLNFENLTAETVEKHQIIIQTTPVGTFPNIEECLKFPFDGLSEKNLIIDLIYNPERTKFMKKALEKGSKAINGYMMLKYQAEKAWEIWNLDK